MSSDRGWIGVDLDGTLAKYDGWKGSDHIGDPVPLMVGRLRGWLKAGRTVKIFTARVSGPPEEADEAARVIRMWLHTHGLPQLEITCKKDYGMVELWDDRCVQVVPNTGIPIGGHEVVRG